MTHRQVEISGQIYAVADEKGCVTQNVLLHARNSTCMAMHVKHGPNHDDKECFAMFTSALAIVRGNRPPTVPITLDEARLVMKRICLDIAELLEPSEDSNAHTPH